MILSVSRRTDIPNYYSEWFFNRIKEGFVYVRNPMNPHQVSKIDITPQVVDCIVFWTKNPEPMLGRLDELASYDRKRDCQLIKCGIVVTVLRLMCRVQKMLVCSLSYMRELRMMAPILFPIKMIT